MTLKAISPYFIVKVPKKLENERREKDGNLYIPPTFVWMTRNTQYGFIHSISPEAKKQMPISKEGDLLIMHHLVQGSLSMNERSVPNLLDSDEIYNYYNVTSKECAGQRNQTYGIWDGDKITPHNDYIFLQEEIPILEQKEDNELLLTGDFKLTNDEIVKRLAQMKKLSETRKSKLTKEIINTVKVRENLQMEMGAKLHHQEVIPYKIAYSNNPVLQSSIYAYAKNFACNLIIEFNNIRYRVVEKKYVVAYF